MQTFIESFAEADTAVAKIQNLIKVLTPVAPMLALGGAGASLDGIIPAISKVNVGMNSVVNTVGDVADKIRGASRTTTIFGKALAGKLEPGSKKFEKLNGETQNFVKKIIGMKQVLRGKMDFESDGFKKLNKDTKESLEAVSKLVQVEQADACTEYEPYTGGVPKLYSDKIGVTAHGKNLFDLEYALKKENWNMIPGRYYYIPYYVGKGATVTVSYDGKPALGLGAYVLVGEKAGETENSYGWLYHSSVQSLVNNTKTFVAEADYIYINGAADYINMFRKHFKNFQIEVSPSPTAYEPYHEPQSLSIQTPTGLPAIPVTSGGNYTDADGQQWIADYVDLKRGKYVQNINTCMIDASTNVFKIGKGGFYWNLPENSLPGILKGIGVGSKYPIFPSKYFARKVFNANAVYSMLYTDDDNMKGLFNSVEELNTFCKERYDAGDPVEFYYVIEPIERDLTPEEIQAYKNLVTYAGTTIVENDAECYMEVSAGGGDSLRAKKLALILGE